MMAIKQPVFLRERSPSRMLDFKSARNYRIGGLLYLVSCWLVVGLIAAAINRLLG